MSAERVKWSAPGLGPEALGVASLDALFAADGTRAARLERYAVLEDSPARLHPARLAKEVLAERLRGVGGGDRRGRHLHGLTGREERRRAGEENETIRSHHEDVPCSE